MKGTVGHRDGPRGRSYFYRIDLGRDGAGKRRQKTRRGFPTEHAAYAAMQDELVQRRRGSYVEPSTEPTETYLRRWLAASAPRWRPITRAGNEDAVNRLCPLLGTVPLGDLNPLLIQDAYATLTLRLAPKTLHTTHTLFKQALTQAVRWRLLPGNPADGVSVPPIPRKAIATWTIEQMRRFLAATARDDEHALWRLLLDSGMRIGEAQALHWSDLDLAERRVTIRRSATKDAAGLNAIGDDAKTPAGRRTVPLAVETARELTAHRKRQLARRVALGPMWQDHDLVFDNGTGRMLYNQAANARLRLACEAAAVPRLTCHGLRHTNATLLIQAGVPVKVVSERLGHTSVTITLNRYVHPDAAAHRDAADIWANVLLG